MTKAVASKNMVNFPLPSSARSICSLFHAGGLQDLECYVRFEVDPKALDWSIDALAVWNNKEFSRKLAYPREPLSSSEIPLPRKEFLRMPWWDPETITAGYYRGYIDAFAFRIRVDQARSRIYASQND